jgi:hypothetical protein
MTMSSMCRVRACVLGAAVVAGSCLLAPPVCADGLKFGLRGGYYTKVEEPFVGAELLVPMAHRFYFNPNIEYVFVNSGSYLTYNADFHYDFGVSRNTFVWLGGGLGVVRVNPEGPDNSSTDAAANFLGGIGFRAGSAIPYFQAKVIAKSGTEFALAFGVRF